MLAWRSGSRAPVRPGGNRVWSTRRQELLRQAGLRSLTSKQLLAIQALAGVLSLLTVQVLTRTLAVAACFAVFAFFGPVALVRRLRLKRQTALRELWPEAIDNLGSAVRAGMSLPEGVSSLGGTGPEPLRPSFRKFAGDYRASGRFSDCLDLLKQDLADPVGDRVCETLRVAREVGGTDLGSVLRTLSELLRVDARTRAELETRQGWTVNAARLAVAAPWLVLLLLGSQSDALRNYDSSGGVLLLTIGAGICLLAYRIMLRIGRLPEEPRVLR